MLGNWGHTGGEEGAEERASAATTVVALLLLTLCSVDQRVNDKLLPRLYGISSAQLKRRYERKWSLGNNGS